MSPLRLLVFKFIFVSLLLGASASASTQDQDKVAKKFDEFGDIAHSDLMARLDNFVIQLMNEPSTKGFLIVYRTRRDLPGLNHSRAMRMKYYLIKTRGLPRDRVATVDGGVAEHLTQELSIVPPGTAPFPRSDARIGYVQNPDSAWKFDEQEFVPEYQFRKYGLQLDRETEIEYLEAYANEVNKRPNQLACIIAYAQYNRRAPLAEWSDSYEPLREVPLDPRGTARNELNREKAYLMTAYGIPDSKIKVIDGGYRKRRWIEFWIVPAEEPLPIPTPNAFPFGRRRRK